MFAAIGPDSATLLGQCAHPAPVSVIAIHGTADRNIPYDGGGGDGFAHIDGPSVPAVNARWRHADGCAAPASHTRATVTTSVARCPGGRAVELITIAGRAISGRAPHRARSRRSCLASTRRRPR
jgi:polyhydroxybutyrate depolymerase